MKKSSTLSWLNLTASVLLGALPVWLAAAPAAHAMLDVQWSTGGETAPHYRLTIPSGTCQKWRAPSGSTSHTRIGIGTLDIMRGVKVERQHRVDAINDGNRLILSVLPTPSKWVFTVQWDRMFERVETATSMSMGRRGTMTYFAANAEGKLEEKQNWPVFVSLACNSRL